jgi:alkylhydroperoxidase family enzyme
VLRDWTQLEQTFFQRSLLPADLLEQVRRTLALGHGCEYCQARSGPPDAAHAALRTSVAVGFAQLFAAGHREISTAHLAELRRHFTDPEQVELVSFISFMWAGGTFGSVLGIKPG